MASPNRLKLKLGVRGVVAPSLLQLVARYGSLFAIVLH